MAGRIANGVKLTEQAWRGLKDNPFMLWYPIIGAAGASLMAGIVLVPSGAVLVSAGFLKLSVHRMSPLEIAAVVIVLILCLFAVAFATLWANTALVASALKVVRGEQSSIADGISTANARLSRIAGFSLFSATIGTLATVLRSGDNRATALAASALTGAWNVISFFALPVMVAEDVSLKQTFTETVEVFKKTWGEGFTGSLAVSGVSGIMMMALAVVCVCLIGFGIYISNFIVILAAFGLLIVGGVVLLLVQEAVNGVLKASLYTFAKTGDAGCYVDSELAAKAYSAG